MRSSISALTFMSLVTATSGCATDSTPTDTSHLPRTDQMRVALEEASQQCAGSGYVVLGDDFDLGVEAEVDLSEGLLDKGVGQGEINVGMSIETRTEFARLLGTDEDGFDRFLDRLNPVCVGRPTQFLRYTG